MTDTATAAEFARARDARDCKAMHAFADKHGGSGWKQSVTEFLANCQMREQPVERRKTMSIPFFARDAKTADREALRLCTKMAGNHDGKLMSSRVSEHAANGSGAAACEFAYQETELQEVHVGR